MDDNRKTGFDLEMARYVHSVSHDALAEMAKEFAHAGNDVALQTIIDSGVLDGAWPAREFLAPDRMVDAIYPLMFADGYGARPKLFNDWLSRCARSNPGAVADLAYNLVAHNKIEAAEFVGFLEVCGLNFMSPMSDQKISICANNRQSYDLYEMTLGGTLLLRQNGSLCTRSMIRDMGLKGSLDEVPVLALSVPENEAGANKQRSLNLLDLALLGNSPDNLDSAAETFMLALSMLDMDKPEVKRALTDALVRANNTEVFDADGAVEPIDLIAIAIDAGCELEGRYDLVLDRGFRVHGSDKRAPLLSRLVSMWVKPEEVDYPPTNLQSIEAARRVILEGGADPNAYDDEGLTALHRAILVPNRPMIEMLLELGADPRMGRSGDLEDDAAAFARSEGKTEVEAMLRAWVAKEAIERTISAARYAIKGAM